MLSVLWSAVSLIELMLATGFGTRLGEEFGMASDRRLVPRGRPGQLRGRPIDPWVAFGSLIVAVCPARSPVVDPVAGGGAVSQYAGAR